MAAISLAVLYSQNRFEAGVALPNIPAGVTALAATPGLEGYFAIDSHNLELLRIDGAGRVTNRFGGWGVDDQSLDLPVDLDLAENSIFVLDQGKRQIMRFDLRLNLVGTTPLDADLLPVSFARDAQQRFWVACRDRAGLFLYDDFGILLGFVGNEASGERLISAPGRISAGAGSIAVIDDAQATVHIIDLSGSHVATVPFEIKGIITGFVWTDELLAISSEHRIKFMNTATKWSSVIDIEPTIQGLSLVQGALLVWDAGGRLFEYPLPD
ncbi:MAG: hypothetical protein KAU50_04330 [Candidatus Marinimicrobia bacterium]|nr:hypothetical protein [Candidatus Neomarinimicrobiota bacterium]